MIFLLLLMYASPFAKANDDVCIDTNIQVLKTFPMPEEINYFIRAGANGDIGLATWDGNRILHTSNGKIDKVLGEQDPVLTPDNNLLAIPIETKDGGDGYTTIHFYRRDPKNPAKLKLLLNDKSVEDVYQSLGVLSTSGSKVNYRMLFKQDNSIAIKEYSYDAKGGSLKAKGPANAFCKKLGPDVELPMLSKDGREFSVYDYSAHLTQVYLIKPDESCELTDSLPITAGKADFSPDRRKILFHATAAKPDKDNAWFDHPQTDMGVYLYDRDTKGITLLAAKRGEANLFPVFLDDKTFAYVSATGKYPNATYSIKVASLPTERAAGCPSCFTDESLRKKASAVGALYGLRCRQSLADDPDMPFLDFSTLSRARCTSLLNSATAAHLSRVGTAKQDLLSACEAITPEKPAQFPDRLPEPPPPESAK